MGKPGPRPTPTAILKARGSRRAALRADTPSPPVEAPNCPEWLDELARDCWSQMAEQLLGLGVLAKIDGNALTMYCVTWARWVRAERFIQEHGDTYVVKDRYGKVKRLAAFPQVRTAQRLSMLLKRLESEFGLTPSDRARLNVQPQTAAHTQADSLTDYLGVRL